MLTLKKKLLMPLLLLLVLTGCAASSPPLIVPPAKIPPAPAELMISPEPGKWSDSAQKLFKSWLILLTPGKPV